MIVAKKIIDGKNYAVLELPEEANLFERTQPYTYGISYTIPSKIENSIFLETKFVDLPAPCDIIGLLNGGVTITDWIIMHLTYFVGRSPNKTYLLIVLRDTDKVEIGRSYFF